MVTFTYGPLNRIINVHWAVKEGGIFVAGTECPSTEGVPPAVLYAKLKGKKSAPTTPWETLGPFSFGEFGRIWAGAYAKIPVGEHGTPVFLLGGDDGAGALGHGAEQGVLMRSTNGRDWTEVHRVPVEDPEFLVDSSFLAIVWNADENLFYAEGTMFENGRPTGPQQVNILYRSDTGESWAEVQRKT